jgi:Cu+-exporting ATPase
MEINSADGVQIDAAHRPAATRRYLACTRSELRPAGHDGLCGGHHGEEQAMEKDVVCGMEVDPAKAAGTSQYGGKTYYFCSTSCKTRFDANPAQYLK